MRQHETRQTGTMVGAKHILVLFLLLQIPLIPPAKSAPTDGHDSAPAPARLDSLEAPRPDSTVTRPLGQLTEPFLETTVVGFSLQGPGPLDRKTLDDFDILLREDGRRFLPLLRSLRVLNVGVVDSGTVLSFQPDGTPSVVIDYAARAVRVGSSSRPLDMIAGLSDVTGLAELYVPEAALADLLAMEVTWRPELYEIALRSPHPLKVFERRLGRSPPPVARGGQAAIELPDNLPPASADRSLMPRLQFAEIRLQSSLVRREHQERALNAVLPPHVNLWAHAMGGNLIASVTQREVSPKAGYSVDRLSWTTGFENAAMALGNNNVGLSDLVFPSLSLTGATFNGRLGFGFRPEERDPSLLGKRRTYSPARAFEGWAPLGSEVTLSINGRAIETRRAESAPGAAAGEGFYRFEGLNLLTSRLNEIQIVTRAPDGTVEESWRRVLGTDLLLPPGSMAFVGGLGGRRRPGTENLSTDGRFAGGRLDYGLARRLSVGLSAGFQDGLYQRDLPRTIEGGVIEKPPPRSLHLGSRLVWQLLDPLLLFAEAARSAGPADSASDWAIRAETEYLLGDFRLHPAAFRYGPSFFDGQTPEIRNVAGTSLGLTWRRDDGDQLSVAASRLTDNLDRREAWTARMTGIQAGWTFRHLVPVSTLTLGGRRNWIAERARLDTWFLGLSSRLPWRFDLRINHEAGDDFRRQLRKELPPGTPTRFDFGSRAAAGVEAESFPGFGSPSTVVDLRRRLGQRWQLATTHRASSSIERTMLDLVRSPVAGGSLQLRFSQGYDWRSEAPFLQNRVEYFLDRGRWSRVGLECQYLDREWSVGLSAQIQLNVGFSNMLPVPLVDTRLDPDAGGVRGRVFVDFNGNGLLDDGEPGLEKVEVVGDMGRRIFSGKGGLFVFPNTMNLRRTRISLRPESLRAIHTPTQATQEAVLRPGMFTEVNLGVAAFGAVSGAVLAEKAGPDSTAATGAPEIPPGAAVGGAAAADSAAAEAMEGVSGVRVLLIDGTGRVAGHSITDSDGSFYLGDVKPGRYTVKVEPSSLPPGFELTGAERQIEVRAGIEPEELTDVNLVGRFTSPAGATRSSPGPDQKEIRYRKF